MATKTATVSTSDWDYIDVMGIAHPVTDSETFQFTLTDGGAAAVTYNIIAAQSVATDDGYTVSFRPETMGAESNNAFSTMGPLADTMDGVATVGVGGELVCECPLTGTIQRWTLQSVTINDIDTPTELTEILFEDQFGHKMKMVTVAVA